MKLSATLAVILALALFAAGWFVRGWGVEKDRALLRDSAARSREASRVGDSLRAADRLAFDAERAELSARVTSLQLRARTLGAAATRLLVDTVMAQAPDTCLPGLTRLRFAWSLHLDADSAANVATTNLLRADSLELATERRQTSGVMAERDTAQARLTRALAMPGKRSGFLPGVVAGVVIIGGMVLLAR